MSGVVWAIIAIAFLFVLAVVVAIAETAFLRMNRVKALALEEDGAKGAGRLVRVLEHPVRTVNAVALMALAGLVITANLIGVLIGRRAGGVGLIVGIVLSVVVFFVLAEAAPKPWAVEHSERAALRTSAFLWFLTEFPPLRVFVRGLLGFVNFILPGKGLKQGPFVTETE